MSRVPRKKFKWENLLRAERARGIFTEYNELAALVAKEKHKNQYEEIILAAKIVDILLQKAKENEFKDNSVIIPSDLIYNMHRPSRANNPDTHCGLEDNHRIRAKLSGKHNYSERQGIPAEDSTEESRQQQQELKVLRILHTVRV